MGDWRPSLDLSLVFRLQLREWKRFHVDALLACDKTLKRGKVTLQQGIKKGPGTKSGPQVAVIGGSASGFFTASLLARAGCSVEVLERSDQLDPTPRTLIVTSHMRTLLGQVGEARGRQRNPQI